MTNQDYWDKVTEDTELDWLCRRNLLSTRTSNIFRRGARRERTNSCNWEYHPIKTVKELLELDECDLVLYRNMGKKSLEEIEVFKQKFLEKSNVQKLHNPITEQGQADWLDGYKVGFRDGVVAVQTQLNEICKEITGGKV